METRQVKQISSELFDHPAVKKPLGHAIKSPGRDGRASHSPHQHRHGAAHSPSRPGPGPGGTPGIGALCPRASAEPTTPPAQPRPLTTIGGTTPPPRPPHTPTTGTVPIGAPTRRRPSREENEWKSHCHGSCRKNLHFLIEQFSEGYLQVSVQERLTSSFDTN